MATYLYAPSGYPHFSNPIGIQDDFSSHQCTIEANTTLQEREVSWKKPPPGWWKLNTDGCSKGNPGQSSGGGVIRQEDGCWIAGFYGSMGYSTGIRAELWAIQEGLQLAIMKGATHLVIETDCLSAVNMIQDYKWHQDDPIIQQIRNLVKGLSKYEIYHVYREGNKIADFLANLGLNNKLQYLDIAPDGVTELLVRDSVGFVYLRTK